MTEIYPALQLSRKACSEAVFYPNAQAFTGALENSFHYWGVVAKSLAFPGERIPFFCTKVDGVSFATNTVQLSATELLKLKALPHEWSPRAGCPSAHAGADRGALSWLMNVD